MWKEKINQVYEEFSLWSSLVMIRLSEERIPSKTSCGICAGWDCGWDSALDSAEVLIVEMLTCDCESNSCQNGVLGLVHLTLCRHPLSFQLPSKRSDRSSTGCGHNCAPLDQAGFSSWNLLWGSVCYQPCWQNLLQFRGSRASPTPGLCADTHWSGASEYRAELCLSWVFHLIFLWNSHFCS